MGLKPSIFTSTVTLPEKISADRN